MIPGLWRVGYIACLFPGERGRDEKMSIPWWDILVMHHSESTDVRLWHRNRADNLWFWSSLMVSMCIEKCLLGHFVDRGNIVVCPYRGYTAFCLFWMSCWVCVGYIACLFPGERGRDEKTSIPWWDILVMHHSESTDVRLWHRNWVDDLCSRSSLIVFLGVEKCLLSYCVDRGVIVVFPYRGYISFVICSLQYSVLSSKMCGSLPLWWTLHQYSYISSHIAI